MSYINIPALAGLGLTKTPTTMPDQVSIMPVPTGPVKPAPTGLTKTPTTMPDQVSIMPVPTGPVKSTPGSFADLAKEFSQHDIMPQPQPVEVYRGWSIFRRFQGLRATGVLYAKNPAAKQISEQIPNPFQKDGPPVTMMTWNTDLREVTGGSLDDIKKKIDGVIAGTYVPPEVLAARKRAHTERIMYSANQAFQAAIPVPRDMVHARGGTSATEAYKGWVIKENWYTLKSEAPASVDGLGFIQTATIQVQPKTSVSRYGPKHYIFVAVNDSDPTQTLVATTKEELKAKIDAIVPPQVPANAPVAATTTMSAGKKLAVAGGLAAAAFLFMQG